jgi:hypothetical protein
MPDRIEVENQDGITVGDVLDAIHTWSVGVVFRPLICRLPSQAGSRHAFGRGMLVLTRRNRYKQPPTEELRQQVLDRMLDSLGWDGSTLVELANFETREAMLEELYDRESAV